MIRNHIHTLFLFHILLLIQGHAEAQHTPLSTEQLTGNLSGATSLSVTPSGVIYISEETRNRFLVLSPEGERTDSLGARGSGDYRFSSPRSIDATNGLKIYIADHNNGRVQLYDRRLQYLSSISASKIGRNARLRPSLVTSGSGNDLYIYDADQHRIFIFDHNGNYSGDIDLRRNHIGEISQMKSSGDELLLLEPLPGVIHRFESAGLYRNFIGGFQHATSFHPAGDQIWASYPNRIVRHGRTGNRNQVLLFEHGEEITDMALNRNKLFLLTETQLMTAQIE